MQLVYKTRGHPRAKHLVYVVVAGSRATQCRKRGSKRIPSRRETAKNHEKRHAIVFFGAVSSRSGHRSVGYRSPYDRRRSETKSSGSGPWDVGLCVVRILDVNAGRAENATNKGEIWLGPSQPSRRASQTVPGDLAARAPQTSVSGQPRGNKPTFVNMGRQPLLFAQGGLK